jgi:hypothetical protein
MNRQCTALSKSAVWAMVVGASLLLGGCGGDTPAGKTEGANQPAAANPYANMTLREKTAQAKKDRSKDEPSAQERRRAKLKEKTSQ